MWDIDRCLVANIVFTAGTLWTPMYDKVSFANSVDGLIRQINLAVAPDADFEAQRLQELPTSPDFSTKELREELDRLKGAEDTASVNENQPACGQASVPALAPELPPGVFVTQSMEELLSHLITGDKTRVGFLVIEQHTPTPDLGDCLCVTCATNCSHGVGHGRSWKDSRSQLARTPFKCP